MAITGAGAGIGAALARRYARAGCRVALLDVDLEAARGQAEALAAEGHDAISLACDVTDPAACEEAVKRIREAWGGLDVWVNNAGLTQLGLVRDTRPEVIRRVMEVNFQGAVNGTLAALPSLLERRGQVVALSSVAGFAPLATRAAYSASKHALHGFFDSLRAEHVRDGLGVTLVCPSFVRTGIGERALGSDGAPAGTAARSGVGHEMEPEAAAEAIFRGIERRRPLVLVGREARLSWWVSRLWPGLYERAMRRRTLPPER